MPKPRKGWMLIQVALPIEDVQLMKVLAAVRNETHGEVLHAALSMSVQKLMPSADGRPEIGAILAPFSAPGAPSGPRPPGRPQKGKYSAKVLPPPSLEEELEAKGYPWTWDRLQEAFSLTETKPKNLAAHLGLTNISPWAGSGVPEKWWPLIRKFFEARGWTAPEQQQSIFSQD